VNAGQDPFEGKNSNNNHTVIVLRQPMSNLWTPEEGSTLLDTVAGFNLYTLLALFG